MSIAFSLHLLAALIWVGGMFFAYIVLRPVAAQQLEPSVRLKLWQGVFTVFFKWVWPIVFILPVSGYWMIFVEYQGMANAGTSVHLMQLIGWLMIGIFVFLYYSPYQALKKNLTNELIPAAASNLNRIRQLIAANLSLGIIIVLVASTSRY